MKSLHFKIWLGRSSLSQVAILHWLLCLQLVTEICILSVRSRWFFQWLSCSWVLHSFHSLWETLWLSVKNSLKRWVILIKKGIWMIFWFQFKDLKTGNQCKSHFKYPLRSTLTIFGLTIESIFSKVNRMIKNYCQKLSKKTWFLNIYSRTYSQHFIDSLTLILWIIKSCWVTFLMVSCLDFSHQLKMIALYMMKTRRCQNCTSSTKASSV